MKTNLKTYILVVGFCLLAAMVTHASPVTFRVENYLMDTNSDIADVRGTFNGWSAGYNLVPSDNPYILTNTFEIPDAPGTVHYYKFTVNGSYELSGVGDRPFTLTGDPQVLPLVYFNDLPPEVSATTNSITFRVSMSTQVTLGNFDPTNDTVSVAGTFQRPLQWIPQAFQLTNNGANVYVGTFTNDGNYPGTYEEFKFVATHWWGDEWEYINNRSFILTNGMVLPVVYFNNLGDPVPVTFQVDMAAQATAGRFNSGFEIVECKGSFNGWFGGFVLTNDPSAINTNLFSGTTFIFDSPGTTEYYRFTVNGGFAGLGWESPVSTDGRDRSFNLPTNALTLSSVFWSDWTAADVLPAFTLVTFTVNMTNAVGTDAHVFDSDLDTVYLNGDWIPWWSWGSLPAGFQMTNNPVGSKLYSIELPFPQGFAVPLNYKYSINGLDNEAGFGTNHVRYIRATNNYALPMDTFGNQFHEISFGNLTIGPATAGQVPLSWLGRPGVHLQTTTNLGSTTIWQDSPETDGLSSTNFTTSVPRMFFRLIKP